jgi:hypothetical protein
MTPHILLTTPQLQVEVRDREINHIWGLFLTPYISGNDRCLRFGLRALGQEHGVSLKPEPQAALTRSRPKRSWLHPGSWTSWV